MSVKLYMDVHVPWPITEQLQLRGVDVLTAQGDSADTLPDDELLQRATELERVMFTQDIRFNAMAEKWQRDGRTFGGLVFGHQLHATIGKYVTDLELIAKSTDPDEWVNTIERLPF